MSAVILLFGGGLAFFVGIGCIAIAVFVFSLTRRTWLKAIASLVTITGLLLVATSSTPLPYWLYALAGGTTVMLLIAERSEKRFWINRRLALRILVIAIWLTCAELERRYQTITPLAQGPHHRLVVIGDSLAAGVGDRAEIMWPRLLAARHSIEVENRASVGATAASAFSQVKTLERNAGLILIEIGGNDVLGTTTAANFEANLDRLLATLRQFSGDLVMFELPLPPLHNEFGRIQRQLAHKHSVKLIPKRVLASVLAESDATIDSLHLSPQGNDRLAGAVWDIIAPAFSDRQ